MRARSDGLAILQRDRDRRPLITSGDRRRRRRSRLAHRAGAGRHRRARHPARARRRRARRLPRPRADRDRVGPADASGLLHPSDQRHHREASARHRRDRRRSTWRRRRSRSATSSSDTSCWDPSASTPRRARSRRLGGGSRRWTRAGPAICGWPETSWLPTTSSSRWRRTKPGRRAPDRSRDSTRAGPVDRLSSRREMERPGSADLLGLYVDHEVDLLADQEPAGLDGDVPRQVPVFALDRGLGLRGEDRVVVRVLAPAQELTVERDGLGDVADREVTDQLECSCRPYAGSRCSGTS